MTTATLTHMRQTADLIHEAIVRTASSRFPDTGWAVRHAAEWSQPKKSVTMLIKAWLLYADEHRARYESGVGDDGFLGREWANIGFSLRDLLNGELGGLDGGLADATICDALGREGWSADTQERQAEQRIVIREDCGTDDCDNIGCPRHGAAGPE
jgi:hypothetical protein